MMTNQFDKIFATQKKEKRHFDFDYYSDETDIESEDEPTDNEDSNDEFVIRKEKKNIKKKSTRTPAKKQKKKQKRIMGFINT